MISALVSQGSVFMILKFVLWQVIVSSDIPEQKTDQGYNNLTAVVLREEYARYQVAEMFIAVLNAL